LFGVRALCAALVFGAWVIAGERRSIKSRRSIREYESGAERTHSKAANRAIGRFCCWRGRRNRQNLLTSIPTKKFMNEKRVEVIFAPAEYAALGARDLSGTVCVVFDILRATTTMMTALANGAAEIVPVSEIAEALALREKDERLLLAGERGGLRIRAEQTGSVDFNFGNSPREFTEERVRGRRIAITTTNGTRALRACAHAAEVWIGSFLNMAALAKAVAGSNLSEVLIVCAGTAEEASLEDTLAAGALCETLEWSNADARASGALGETRPTVPVRLRDSAQIALATYLQNKRDLLGAMANARNGRKLLSIPELAPDVAICFQRDTLSIIARMHRDGAIRVRA
jgi:2-phosphosulfolactate phosphatase